MSQLLPAAVSRNFRLLVSTRCDNNCNRSHLLKTQIHQINMVVRKHPPGPQIRCVFFSSVMPISSPNPVSDNLLESSHRDDSNKWSNIGFSEEMTQIEYIEVYLTQPI